MLSEAERDAVTSAISLSHVVQRIRRGESSASDIDLTRLESVCKTLVEWSSLIQRIDDLETRLSMNVAPIRLTEPTGDPDAQN